MIGTYILNAVLILAMVGHLFNCPYSKVEESFNLQAIHDILYHKNNISSYDHLEFPGVVPRSFIGALVVGVISYPVVKLLEIGHFPKIYMQVVSRGILGLMVCLSLIKLQTNISKRVNPSVAKLMTVLTISQFHFLFYASRTVPNTFALILVLHAVSSWIANKNKQFIYYSACAIIIFRSELFILLGFMLLVKLIEKQIGLNELITHGVIIGTLALGTTSFADSYFWQRWLWPEGEVLYYNTVMNKSSNWGTLPYLWYFYSAVPRALFSSIVFVPLGLFSRQCQLLSKLSVTAVIYILIYSFLPHKELRFVIYAFPLLNAAAAIGILKVFYWTRAHKKLHQLVFLCFGIMLTSNICATVFFGYISRQNYPGGEAFSMLHKLNEQSRHDNLTIHIDNAAAQTGVTRFGELYSTWRYSKDESFKLSEDNAYASPYSILIVESPCPVTQRYTIQAVIDGFSKLVLRKSFPFIEALHEPKLCILRTKD